VAVLPSVGTSANTARKSAYATNWKTNGMKVLYATCYRPVTGQ
jgi:hypothetical protein